MPEEWDSSQIDPELRSAAFEYVRDHTDRLPVVIAARQGRTWGFFRPAHQVQKDSDWTRTPTVYGWLRMGTYWALAPLAIAGAVLLRRRGVAIWPMISIVVVVVITTTITFGETRYRAAAEVPIALFSAAALVHLLHPRPASEMAGALSLNRERVPTPTG